ncbi:hypothetical protein, partial [Paracoccus isoporae]|uniref:hypothetical protein n=1 Tax=Paracoccus isoporae TaxID=591205 RepID=UPI00116009C0
TATKWLWTYNNERPNMGNGGITPAMKLKMAARILQPRPVKKGRITASPTLLGLSRSAIAKMGSCGESRISTVANYAAAFGAALATVPTDYTPLFASMGNAPVFHSWDTPHVLFKTIANGPARSLSP